MENLINYDSEEEKLDNEYKNNIQEELDKINKKDKEEKQYIFTYSDIISYLERVGLYGEIATNISIEKIREFINYLNTL